MGAATALACFVLAGFGSGMALASPAEIVAADKCCAFVDGPFEQPRGEVASFVNPVTADAPHNVESTQTGPDGRPLFFSRTISSGARADVRGTQYLRAGRYPFVCSLHGPMTGELVVTDTGVAVRRPSVRLAIPTQRLRAVSGKRVLRVAAFSPTGVSGASLQVRLGRAAVGKRVRLDLPVGARRSVKVRIPAKVARKVKGKRSVAFRAQVSVPFGKPASSRRVIK